MPRSNLILILLVVLLVVMIGGLPFYSYSTDWGYGPSSVTFVVLLVVLILIVFNRI